MKNTFAIWLGLCMMFMAGCTVPYYSNYSPYNSAYVQRTNPQQERLIHCDNPSIGTDGRPEMLCMRNGQFYRFRFEGKGVWYQKHQNADTWQEILGPKIVPEQLEEVKAKMRKVYQMTKAMDPAPSKAEKSQVQKPRKREKPRANKPATQKRQNVSAPKDTPKPAVPTVPKETPKVMPPFQEKVKIIYV